MSEKEAELLRPGQRIKARVEEKRLRQLVELRYGLEVLGSEELDAYDDCNYRLRCGEQVRGNPHLTAVPTPGFVLKVVNSLDSRQPDFFAAQNELLLFLGARGFRCPVPVQQVDGAYYSLEAESELAEESDLLEGEPRIHLLRLLVYQPGRVLEGIPVSARLLHDVGRFAASLDEAMTGFSHPGFEGRASLWSLAAVPRLRDFLFAVRPEPGAEALIEAVLVDFEAEVLPALAQGALHTGLLHGDLNENNLLVSEDGEAVDAVIDFGDSHIGSYLFELAVCLSHMIVLSGSIGMAKHVIDGYQVVRRLPPLEKRLLRLCVCARLAQSLVLGTYSHQKEPGNTYLIRCHKAKWTIFRQLWPMSHDQILILWGLDD